MASKGKPHKYWKGLENIISESKKVMEEQGVDILPTQKELIECGYSGLNVAISRYHGGLNNFREKHLGEELLRKPNGYYTLENTIFEAKKVMEKHDYDTLPPQHKLIELGYNGLRHAIRRYHSGFPNFREIMNQELGIKSNEKEESNKITLKPLYSLGYLQKKTDFGNK